MNISVAPSEVGTDSSGRDSNAANCPRSFHERRYSHSLCIACARPQVPESRRYGTCIQAREALFLPLRWYWDRRKSAMFYRQVQRNPFCLESSFLFSVFHVERKTA